MNDLDIFLNAPKEASPEELAAYLDDACGGDAALRARVEALFACDLKTHGIVDQAPLAPITASGSAAEDEWENAGDVIGPYKLLQKIGEGGFGVVYMAEQIQPVRRRVALKIIKLGMDTRQVIARFEAERQALAMMEHQNIAKVLDAGATESGRPYFVMELVRGKPITTFCDEQELDSHQRLALFQDVCSAVGHAHQKGVIHRDLKPSNILVGLDGDTPIVKVIDFGVAKATQFQLTDKTLFTRFEQFIGTPLYISPEQASLSPIDIDTRSDIYSLGVLLYELLTGKPPIDQEELIKAGFDEMRRLIREKEAPKPSTRLSTATDAERAMIAKARHTEPRKLGLLIKGDLDWIVLKALEKDRRRRYDTTAALRRDIDHFLNNEVVSATPPSAAYKLQKFARRNKGALIAGTALLLALLAGAIMSTSQWLRADEEAANAHVAKAEAAKRQEDAAAARDLARQGIRNSARSDRLAAVDLVEKGREREAMAYLARSSRNDPSATEAFSLSWNLLRNWEAPLQVAAFENPLTVQLRADQAVSPDGSRVAKFGTDPAHPEPRRNIGRVWDTATGKVVSTHVPERPDESVGAVAFDQTGNCLMLVWKDFADAEDRGTARIWDSNAGRYRATLEEEGRHTWPVAFSPDGSRILVSLHGGGFGIWNISTGKLVGPPDQDVNLNSAWFAADGKRVVGFGSAQSKLENVFLWDADSGALIGSVASGPSTEGDYNVSDADCSHVVRGGVIVDLMSGAEIAALEGLGDKESDVRYKKPGSGFTSPVGFSKSGGTGRMINGGTEVRAAFSPDGGLFAASNSTGTNLWDARTGRLLAELPGENGASSLDVQFSADGLLLMTGGSRIWDSRTGSLLATYDGEPGILSPDGSRLIGDSGIWEWWRRGLDLDLQVREFDDAKFTADGSRIVTVRSGVMQSLDRNTLVPLATWEVGHVSNLAFSQDGARAAFLFLDGHVEVRNTLSGAVERSWHPGEGFVSRGSRAVRFSPDGRFLAVRFKESPAPINTWVWDIEGDTLLFSLRGAALEFSADGMEIAIFDPQGNGRLYIHDTLTGALRESLDEGVKRIYHRPDGSGALILTDRVVNQDKRELTLREKTSNKVILACRFSPAVLEFSRDSTRIAVLWNWSVPIEAYDSRTGQQLGALPALYSSMAPAGEPEHFGRRRPDPGESNRTQIVLQGALPEVSEVPGWWADFLELLGMRHFDETQELRSLSGAEREIRAVRLRALLENDRSPAAEAARWLLTPLAEQPVRIGASLGNRDAADRLISVEASSEDLRRAHGIRPDHPLIHLALARDAQDPEYAEFLANHSLNRLPDDPDLKRRAAELQADLDVSRAVSAARRGEWKEAHLRFAKLELRPVPGRHERSKAFFHRARGLLLARASLDDPSARDSYQAYCLESLERAGSNPEERYDTIEISLIAPHPDGSPVPAAALRLAREDYENHPTWESSPRFLGIAEYRMGNYADAIPLLKDDKRPHGQAFHAMALHAQGEHGKAREVLARLIARLNDTRTPRGNAPDWQLRLMDLLAVEEAKRVIGWDPEKEADD